MARFLFCHPQNSPRPQGHAFTILEVLAAIAIATGVISLLVPTLLRQVSRAEESSRLMAVEAVVSRDLNWFANYATFWRLLVGTYDVPSDVTQTRNISGAAAFYVPTPANCARPADSLLNDALKITSTGFKPPYPINKASATSLQGSEIAGAAVVVSRTVTPIGNKIRLSYSSSINGFLFRREESILVEAAAWCDRLP
jgi:type II secretory pathway pseudopilin PulG